MVDLGHYDFKLTDLPTDIDQSISKLVTHIKSIVEANEGHHGRKCGRFYIGKSYLHARKRGRFDPDHPKTTSNKKGIVDRWNPRKKAGFHIMAIIAVITDRNLPEGSKKQQYTLDLESRLIIHFRYCDPRLENETTQPGGLERSHAVAYVLYMAIKFEDTHDVTQPATSDEVKPDLKSVTRAEHTQPPQASSPEDLAGIQQLSPKDLTIPTVAASHPSGRGNSGVVPSTVTPVEPIELLSRLDATVAVTTSQPSRPSIRSITRPPSNPGFPGTPTRPESPSQSSNEATGTHTEPSLSPQAATTREVAGEKRCRCGSSSHQRTNHRQCRLNKRNQDPLQPLLTEIWPRK